MVAIFTGAGAGLERGSGSKLGGAGVLGNATLGRSGEQVLLNAANGNLVISQRDEMLVGRGPDAVVTRTYNSQGDLSDDNGDNWRMSTQRLVQQLTGTVNSWGSTVQRVSGDGSVITYSWNGNSYTATDGAGANDSLNYDGTTWRWTDGDSGVVEVYGGPGNQISQMIDRDGNAVSYTYSGNQLSDIQTANGDCEHYTWSAITPNQITAITTCYSSGSGQNSLTRTHYAYDGVGRLASVTVDLTPEDGSVADGKSYTTNYSYLGDSRLVASISETDGSRLDIGYDGVGRVTSYAETISAGATRTTTIDYHSNYTFITDPAGQQTRLDFDNGSFAPPIQDWTHYGLDVAPATVGGVPAQQYTVQANGAGASVDYDFSVATGDTVTWRLGLAAADGTSDQYLGLYSLPSGWGGKGISSARIVSGPGTITQTQGALWRISGLVQGQVTQLEITRTFDATGGAGAYLYVDAPQGYRQGAPLIVGEPTLTRSTTSTQLTQMDLRSWYTGGLDRTPTGTIDGGTAYSLTVQGSNSGSTGAAYTGFAARASDTFSATVSLQAVGTNTSVEFGLYGQNSQWGTDDLSTAMIVSGPGTIRRAGGGVFIVDGLSATQPTRVQVIRTYDRDEAGTFYIYNGGVLQWTAGAQLIAGAPKLTRLTSSEGNNRLTKITLPGDTSSVQFGYDERDNLTSVTDAGGGVTHYTGYDGRGNWQTRIDPLQHVVTRTYSATNRLLTETETGSDSTTASAAHATQFVYDSGDRLRWTISAEGRVTETRYNGFGQVSGSYGYSATYSGPATEAALSAWAGGTDAARTELTSFTYDVRGNLLTQKDTAVGGDAAGFTRASYTYDQAGQLLSRQVDGQKAERFAYDGMGRVVTSVDLNGAITWTTYSDSQDQTAVTLSDGLTKVSTYDRAGELLHTLETQPGSPNLAADLSDAAQWGHWGVDVTTDGTLYGDPAARYTVQQTGVVGCTANGGTVRPGDVITFEITMKGTSTNDANLLGTVSSVSGWGTDADSTAAILSGPGHVEQSGGGLWRIAGLSTTQETRVRVTRIFHQAEQAFTYVYVGDSGGAAPAGSSVVLGQPAIYKTSASSVVSASNTLDPAAGWQVSGATLTTDGEIGGHPGQRMSVINSGSVGAAYQGTAVQAGQSVSLEFSLRAGTVNYAAMGIYGSVDQWDSNSVASVTILSGPGHASGSGGIGMVDGLSQTQTTRVRVTRTFFTSQSASPMIWAGSSAAAQAGDSIILGDLVVSRTSDPVTAYRYDLAGRLRSVIDPLGNTSYLVYDPAGRKVGDVDASGALTHYCYDAAGRVIATVKYDSKLSAQQMASLADVTSTPDITAPPHSPNDLWNWQIFDAAGRVIEKIDGTGAVMSLDYDASDRLIRTTAFANKVDAQLASFRMNPPTAPVLPPPDGSNDHVSRSFYDADGRLIGSLDGEGYLSTVSYDGMGQKVAETAYARQQTDAGLCANGTLAQLTAGFASAGDRTSHYAYDAQGFLIFEVDPAGQVTEYVRETGALSDATGPARAITRYSGTISAAGDWSVAAIRSALTAANLATSPDNRTSYNVYNDRDQLVYAIDAGGAVTAFSYDVDGRVTKTIAFATARPTSQIPDLGTMQIWAAANPDTNDRTTRSYYSARGDLVYQVDAENHVTGYGYDALGRATSTSRYDGVIAALDTDTPATIAAKLGGPAVITTTSAYDGVGNLVDRYEPQDADKPPVRRHFDYDVNGSLLHDTVAYGTPDAVTTSYQYDGAGRTTQVTTADGATYAATTRYDAYDAFGHAWTITDAKGNATHKIYGRRGELSSETDAEDHTTSYGYNAFGEVTSVTDDALHNTSYSYYDTDGRVTATRDAENYVTQTSYTVFGEVRTVTRRADPTVAAIADLPPIDPQRDAVTTFEYDKLGRVKKTIDAMQNWESKTYDAFGDVRSATNKLGLLTTYDSDHLGRVTNETVGDPSDMAHAAAVYSGQSATGNPTYSYVSRHYEYDALGNLKKLTEAPGRDEERVTVYYYDLADRLIRTERQSVPVGLSRTPSVTTEKYTYDSRGNQVEVTDANDSSTFSYYDKLNRKVAEISAVRTYTHYDYDPVGNLTSTLVYAKPVTYAPPVGGADPGPAPGSDYRQTSYDYYNDNRLKQQTVASVRVGAWNGSSYQSSSSPLSTDYTYDAAGNVTSVRSPGEAITYSYYDKSGRKTAQVDAEGYLTSWELDAEGNVLTECRYATKTSGASVGQKPIATADACLDRVTKFTYDLMGNRKIEIRLGVEAWAVNATNGAMTSAPRDAQIAYTYNALGEVSTKTEATNDTTVYTYDAAGRLIYEKRPQIDTTDAGATQPATEYRYDGLGDLVQTIESGARTTLYSYSHDGRLNSVTDAGGATRNYYYDAGGRKIRESWQRRTSDVNAAPLTEGIVYDYDEAGRVVRQYYASPNANWAMTGTYTKSAYNAFGELTAHIVGTSSSDEQTQDQYSYDHAGRLTASNAGDGVWRYHYYDADGHETLTIQSAGTDLQNIGADAAYNRATSNETPNAGASYVAGINVTITQYNARGLATFSRQAQRQLTETSGSQNLDSSADYNAFGEKLYDTDTGGYTTNYVYNTMGRLTQIIHPEVTSVGADGQPHQIRPTETMFYDLSGRLVGSADANGSYGANGRQTEHGNLITRALVAGTGYGGSEALVAAEFHPDGVIKWGYDRFGDQISRQDPDAKGFDANGATGNQTMVTTMGYDAMGRLTSVINPGGLIDNYVYDELGHRVRHWNNQFGDGAESETTDYDIEGRITATRAFGGDTSTVTYTWSSALALSGIGSHGGVIAATSYSYGHGTQEADDLFGHQEWKSDLGGHTLYTSYDAAGRVSGTSGAATKSYSYFNTGLVDQVTVGALNPGSQTPYAFTRTIYGYDARGLKASEVTSSESGYWVPGSSDPYNYIPDEFEEGISYEQNAIAHYDALGRMTDWAETGRSPDNSVAGTTPAASLQQDYDAVGNIRHIHTTHTTQYHGVTAQTGDEDQWFLYDATNRVVTSGGALVNRQIVRGEAGVDYTYDGAGRRLTATRQRLEPGSMTYTSYDPAANDGWGGEVTQTDPFIYKAQSRETYGYDAAGRLVAVRGAQSGYIDNGDHTYTLTTLAATDLGTKLADYGYDAFGHQTDQHDYAGTTVAYSRHAVYDSAGRVTSETDVTRQGTDTIESDVLDTYLAGAGIASSTSTNYKNGASDSTSSTTTNYAWYDGAVTASQQVSGPQNYTTSYGYDGAGQLVSATLDNAVPSTVGYTSNALGQVIARSDQRGSHSDWYRLDGKELGFITNDAGSVHDGDYLASDAARAAAPGGGAYANGATSGSFYARFGAAPDAITSYDQGQVAARYTVRAGDSLASIAAQLWGDASLWYKLAQANGLTADSALTPGQSLTIPQGVMRAGDSASTFRPYNAAEATGTLSPTTPQPQAAAQSHHGCGVFGQIILIVIAAVVTAINPVGGFIGGVIDSAITQGIGLATGLQDRFSVVGLVTSGLTSAFAAVSGVNGIFGKIAGSAVLGRAVSGAVVNAAVQGVEIATGLQKHFDFAGVAAAGIGAGVGSALGGKAGASLQHSLGSFGAQLVQVGARDVAEAATRSLITGTDFGDNLVAVLPDVIGQTVGSWAADRISRIDFGGEEADDGPASSEKPAVSTAPVAAQVAGGSAASPQIDYLTADVATLLYRDAKTAALFGADPETVERLAMRDRLARDVFLAAEPDQSGSAAGNGFVSELVRSSVSDTPSPAFTYFEQDQREETYRELEQQAGANPTPAVVADLADLRTRLDLNKTKLDAAYAMADRVIADDARFVGWTGVQIGVGFAGELPNAAYTGYELYNHQISPVEAALSVIPGERLVGAAERATRGELIAAETAVPNITANRVAGDAIRDMIAAREAPALTEQTFTTVGGVRRVDVLKLGDDTLAIESKVGRTSLGSRERQELARDWWLQRQGQVGGVRWEFSPSGVNGGVGPSPALQRMLDKLGFETRINK